MKESFENPSAIPPTETGEESLVPEQPDESVSTPESIEAESHTIEDTPQERVEALEEGIRLTEIGRDTAVADLERWKNTNTTEPSHFEFHLPEIQNRISRAEHSISSSRLDIDLINSGAESPEQEDEVVKGFIADQVMDQRTAGLRNQLSSFDKQEADFNERIERNHRATEKLQAELDDLNTSIESGDPDSDRLKLHRRDVLVEMNGVSDRYETLMQEKIGIDALAQSRESVQSEIDAIVAAGVSEEELPKSLEEDPDYAACLKEADTYSSDDDREFRRNIKYDPAETAEKLFRDRFPQKSAYYARLDLRLGPPPVQEYENPYDDPEIKKVISDIDERVGREYSANVRGEWGTIAQQSALSNSGGSTRSAIEWRHTNRAWESFLYSNPELAEKYRGRIPELDKAFEKRVSSEQKNLESRRSNPADMTVESKPSVVNSTEKMKNEADHSLGEKISNLLREEGVESRVQSIVGEGEFSEAIFFDKEELPAEKLVRLYRGVGHLDASVLEQIPYAMRTESGTSTPKTLDHVRQEVDSLAHDPTYQNLLTYADKVRSYLKPEEVRRLDEDIKRIEDGILEGYSTRKELVMKQIEHNGGYGDSGISPYVSASYNPYEAAGYGQKGLMIIDVPLSEIEDFGPNSTEVNIKGALNKKYITAILPRSAGAKKEREQINEDLYNALQVVFDGAPVGLYENENLKEEREKRAAEKSELDREQWEKDVAIVRQKRVAKLKKIFPEVKFDNQSTSGEELDIYTKAKRDIFDFFKSRLEKPGRNRRNIEDYKYQEKEYGEIKRFNREKVDELMLQKLKILVERLEEKEQLRKSAR